MDSIISLVSVLILTGLILWLSYAVTKSLGKGLGTKARGTHMEMVVRLAFSQDKFIAVVRVGSHYYLIGIASGQISLLAELSEEDLGEALPAAQPYENFKSIMKKYKDNHKKDV